MTMLSPIRDQTIAPSATHGHVAPKQTATITTAVILLDGFSLLTLGSIVDAVHLADCQETDRRVRSELFCYSGTKVSSRSGIFVPVARDMSQVADPRTFIKGFDFVFLCTGDQLSGENEQFVLRLARSARLLAKPICVIGAATRTLAESGLLSKCTDHWSRIGVLAETAPAVSVTNAIFCWDELIATSPGEAATLDFVSHLLSDKLGPKAAVEVSTHLLLGSVRAGVIRQPCAAESKFSGFPAKLTLAVSMIEANIEEQPSSGDIAAAIGISVRQLERLFVKHVGTSPQRYVRQVQLEHALKLLDQSKMEVVEISLACGFRDLSTFNKRFKRAFGLTPVRFRQTGGQCASRGTQGFYAEPKRH